jgi:myosin-5
MVHSYDVGTRAWQVDATEGWIPSEVEEKRIDGDKVTLVFALADGEVCSFILLHLFSFPPSFDLKLI